ncbi:peptidase M28 [Sporosarcina sp. P21c]|uniref:M28 family peptidase n=1 Tax=unclassified Sporosarcina TaxID=2647733 RepID=UPI000C170304|nr:MULTISPECIES: M28 family peptidase [unclassified Sporosarcina]PIC65963.1 peptidase M28 [Sporosarcina sp. P16a]PIC81882.1 peptidase M28 [Sporosarcina sp. P1]PIC88299.1 peptidase M28 [Sporosarcina sp. P21c]PIC91479.1 peptidase M28 [Sporosarcina sp. P25]
MKMKMTWNRLWVRHGWNLKPIIGKEWNEDTHFRAHEETDENMKFLTSCLTKANVLFNYNEDLKLLIVESAPPEEEQWLSVVNAKYRGRTEMCGIYTEDRQLNIYQLDTFSSGVVRQVNRLGIQTEYSCDGHGKRNPFLDVQKGVSGQHLMELLQALGIPCRINRENPQRDTIKILTSQEQLLDLAEQLSTIDQAWLASGVSIEEHLFQIELEQLLNVPGKSGNEGEIRQHVAMKLRPFVDTMRTDSYGNLLAEKTYGSGKGRVILVNAHLDIVRELIPGRQILKTDGVWSSSEGILGADDRAGIAILLQISKYLQTSRFTGTVKYILTVEEEVGLIGASEVDVAFLQNVDAAFVLDRRGSGDIVTSCAGIEYFCTDSFGSAIEEIAGISEAGEWKCTPGGSSDTRIWAAAGIQSVNLSVGYQNEHTNAESLHVGDCYNTVTLLKSLFLNTRMLMPSIRELKRYQATRERISKKIV